jgi:lysophospholipase L1-like esterase
MKRVFRFGILVFGSVFFALLLAEAVLRLAPGLLPVELQQVLRADPRNYGIVHPYIGHLHKPNNALVISGRDFHAIHNTDGHGFRNAWPWPETAEIVALGDSVTFGQGVEDDQAWPAILARSFPTSRIINLGLIGAGPQQYLRVYETFGLKLRPKVVLVGLFTGNDFWDAEMFDLWLKSGAGGSYMVWRDFGRPLSVSLDLEQPLGNLISSLIWRAKLLARKSYVCNLLVHVRGNFNRWMPSGKTIFQAPDGRRLELAPSLLAHNMREARPGRPVFDLVLDSLQRLRSLAKKHGATVLVILQRSKEEVYVPLVGESTPDPVAPLRAALSSLGIPYLDLLDGFRQRAAKGEVFFYERDGHPNARGYALIAELVGAHLKDNSDVYGLEGNVLSYKVREKLIQPPRTRIRERARVLSQRVGH